jgi:hypothetical protein
LSFNINFTLHTAQLKSCKFLKRGLSYKEIVQLGYFNLFRLGIQLKADPDGRAVYKGVGLGRLVAGMAGSNPAGGHEFCLLCVYVVLSCVGRGLCDELIPRPEEFYHMSNKDSEPQTGHRKTSVDILTRKIHLTKK